MDSKRLAELKKEINDLENQDAISLILGYDKQSTKTLYKYSDHELTAKQDEALVKLASQQLDHSDGKTATMVTQNGDRIVLLSHKDELSAVLIADSHSITPALARSHSLLLIEFLSSLEESQTNEQEPTATNAANTQTEPSIARKRPNNYNRPRTTPKKSAKKYTKPNSLPPF